MCDPGSLQLFCAVCFAVTAGGPPAGALVAGIRVLADGAPDIGSGVVAPISMTAAVVFLSSTLVWMIREQSKNFTRMLDQTERKIRVLDRILKIQGMALKNQGAVLKALMTQRVAMIEALQAVRQQGIILDTFHDYLRVKVIASEPGNPLSGKLAAGGGGNPPSGKLGGS